MADRKSLVLRDAAGGFWLVDTPQAGRPYRAPLRLNETGAEIFRALQRGETPADIARAIALREGIDGEIALTDVEEFCAALDQMTD